MPTVDPRHDAYIAKSAPFAQPILRELRRRVHAACPDVVETIKWGMPFFEYHGTLCSSAAFKAHCVFGFWLGERVTGSAGRGAMGSFGRITSMSDLPSAAEFRRLMRKAMTLNDTGAKLERPLKHPKPTGRVPADFATALRTTSGARARFDAFPPGAKREYLEWILSAKAEATRARRIATAAAWIAAGKRRNWKYERPPPTRR